jgi:Uma2 family endonuclease
MVATLISLREYLHTNYSPDMEFVDGALVGRNVGTQLHSLLQTSVASYFHQVRSLYRLGVFTECRLHMGPHTERHRIPDVMVLEQPYTRGKVVTDVPSVVVEIKSPDDTLDEVIGKCLEYAALGIPNIVVLDPDYNRQYLFEKNALRLVSSVVLHLPKNDIDLPLPAEDMFAELTEGE